MKTPREIYDDDIAELYAQIINGAQKDSSGHATARPRLRSWLASKKTQQQRAKAYEAKKRARLAAHERSRYSLGGEPAVKLPRQSIRQSQPRRSPNEVARQFTGHTQGAAITGLERTLNWLGSHRRGLVVLSLCIIMPVLIFASYRIMNVRQTPPSERPTSLAPSEVLVPQTLPEGFSVGSGTSKLENGAIIYTIYSDKGQEITVTQQTKGEAFSQPAIRGATSFKTPVGDAFIFENKERVTGYLFTESVWVLFHSRDAMEPEDMLRLIEAFKI